MKNALFAALLLVPSLAHAGARRIGTLTAPELSPAGIQGLTFDENPDPIAMDGWSHAIFRVSLETGQVQSTYPLRQGEIDARTLAYSHKSSAYFSSQHLYDGDYLTKVDLGAGTVSRVGRLGSFGWLSTSFDQTTGTLWQLDDCLDENTLECTRSQGAQLRTIDTATGHVTSVYNYGGGIGQATALAVDASGQIYAATLAPWGYSYIYRLDPRTGSATFVMDPQLGFIETVNALTFDPTTGRLYAVGEARMANPRTWTLYELVLPDDSDADGIANTADNCPLVANSSQLDSDFDALGDACDMDDDGDGIVDVLDNCPLLPTANLSDHDGDGIGDDCDVDDDNDLVSDGVDACPSTALHSTVDPSGCSIEDLCPCDGGWKSQGGYLGCVATTTLRFEQDELISRQRRTDLIVAARGSTCGK